MIKKFVKDWIARKFNISGGEVSILNAGAGFVTYRTDPALVRDLIHKLRPVRDREFNLVRFGPSGDGGYLIPHDLDGIEACFSPGVCDVSGFEKQCADLGMRVFMADKSVDRPAETHELFHFTKKYVGALSNDDFFTMDEWVNSSLPNSTSDLLLQMDIEGAEYETILRMSDQLMGRCRMIIIEFHLLDQLWDCNFFRLAAPVFEKILKNHSCVHIHPNNCSDVIKKEGLEIPQMMEFTFLRKDRLENPYFVAEFPHEMDADCTPRASLVLPECWYRNWL